MKAFVLSGGSIRGAFQAGVIADLLTSGTFVPDAIYGTSVGSLNGAFLTDRSGRAVVAGEEPDWVAIGNELQNFWIQKITSFEKLGKRRGEIELAVDVLFNQFDGFLDTSPLRALVKRTIKIDNLRRSMVKFFACAVNIANGKTVYASVEDPKIYDYIIASTAIPLVMPIRMINREPFLDGGIREVAPLRQAIRDGATEIICILCQTKDIKMEKFNRKNVIELMGRLTEIVTNETVNNDIEHCEQINDLLELTPAPPANSPLHGKRKIDVKVIRPPKPIELELENFDSAQILKALKFGWRTSQKERRDW